jgi:hypothetical protein
MHFVPFQNSSKITLKKVILIILILTSIFTAFSFLSPKVYSNEQNIDNSANEAPTLGNSILVKTVNNTTLENNPLNNIVKSNFSNFGDDTEESITIAKDNLLIASFKSSDDSKLVLEALKNNPEVEIAQPIYKYTTFVDYNPNSNPLYQTTQWYLKNQVSGMNMPGAWGKIAELKNFDCNSTNNCGGNNATSVAIIDSGVNLNSTDLLAERFDTANSARFYYKGDNTCPTNEFYQTLNLGTQTSPNTINFCRKLGSHPDDVGHGTSVASVMAMQNNTVGGVGVGYNVKVLPIALNGAFSFNSFILAESIEFAVSKGVRVINLSLGTSVDDPYLRQSIQNATDNGIIVVASSGNCGNKTALTCNIGSNNSVNNPVVYPAAYPFVVAVGASNYNTNIANIQKSSYSSFGSYLDFVAPVGESTDAEWGVLAMNQAGSFSDQYIGTSYSAPMVSSLISLAYSVAPNISSELLLEALKASSTDLGAPGFDPNFGNGLVNGGLFIETIAQYDNSHSQWIRSDSIGDEEISTIEFNLKLVTAVRGRNNEIFTRTSTDGRTWSAFVNSGGSLSPVKMIAFDNKLFQSVRGTDNGIYTRSSNDGITWGGWVLNGRTLSEVNMQVFNNRLYQTVRGTDNGVYTRSTNNGVNWTNWVLSGITFNPVNFVVFEGRIIQTHIGTDSFLYRRTSTDGINWTNWVNGGIRIAQLPDYTIFNARLIMSVRGRNNEIFTLNTTDGITWSQVINSGGTLSKISMIANINSNRIMQAIRGTDNGIYTRYSSDGIAWSGWRKEGLTVKAVSLKEFGGQVYIGIVGTNQKYYTRKSLNFETFTPWVSDIDIYAPVKYDVFAGELVTQVFARDYKIAARYLI